MFLLPSLAWSAATAPEVRIYDERTGDVIRVFGENNSDHTLVFHIDLTEIKNARSNGWPTTVTKRCLPGDSVPLTALFQTTDSPAATYSYKLSYSAATPQAEPNAEGEQSGGLPPPAPKAVAHETPSVTEPFNPEYPYRLPVPAGTRCFVGLGYNKGNHINRFALDFMMPEGSPVCAVRDGLVVAASQEKDRKPPDSFGNFIMVAHSDGTSALYADLLEDSAHVKLWQRVKAGDIIAASGDTVESHVPHLHFQINGPYTLAEIKQRNGVYSIPTKFNTAEAKGINLVEREWYTAD